VCILGGGFGGLYTAVKLESLFWPRGTKPRVTLIDQADRFTFKPLLYELLSGAATADEVAPSYSQLLAPYPVTFVQGKVASVLPEEGTADGGSEGGGTVVLDSGESLPYDWLVLALGAETNTFGVPGVKEHALAFSTYEDAMRVNAKLESLAASSASINPEVLVVGGGYAGVELAAAIAEKLRGRGRIQLVTTTEDILDRSPQGQRDAARKALVDDGVSILTKVAVTEIKLAAASGKDESSDSKRVVYVKDSSGQTEILEADLVVWAAGQAPVPRIMKKKLNLPFPADATGATQTDSTLKVLRNRRVFALGDVSVSDGSAPSTTTNESQQEQMGSTSNATTTTEKLPATAQVAFQQADYVAWNIWASINQRPLLRFSYQHLGDMMSLGATKGAVTLPIPVPPPLSAAATAGPLGELLRIAGVKVNTTFAGASDGVTLEGPLAAIVRRAAYLYRQPTDRQRLNVAASWAGQASKQAAEVARQILATSGGVGSGSNTKK
jgi:NADH dehydrogenase FAD-containing subunit